jgi:hypothetical protein
LRPCSLWRRGSCHSVCDPWMCLWAVRLGGGGSSRPTEAGWAGGVGTLASQFDLVNIIVRPLDSDTYHVALHTRDTLPPFSALVQPKVLSKHGVATFVRQAAVLANLMAILHVRMPYTHTHTVRPLCLSADPTRRAGSAVAGRVCIQLHPPAAAAASHRRAGHATAHPSAKRGRHSCRSYCGRQRATRGPRPRGRLHCIRVSIKCTANSHNRTRTAGAKQPRWSARGAQRCSHWLAGQSRTRHSTSRPAGWAEAARLTTQCLLSVAGTVRPQQPLAQGRGAGPYGRACRRR